MTGSSARPTARTSPARSRKKRRNECTVDELPHRCSAAGREPGDYSEARIWRLVAPSIGHRRPWRRLPRRSRWSIIVVCARMATERNRSTAGRPALQRRESGQVRKEAAIAENCKCRGNGSPPLALCSQIDLILCCSPARTLLYFNVRSAFSRSRASSQAGLRANSPVSRRRETELMANRGVPRADPSAAGRVAP